MFRTVDGFRNIMEIDNVTKAATFKSFLHQSYKNTQLLFLWQCFLSIFMRQTSTDDFWGLHKNMNCAFPLSYLAIHIHNVQLKLVASTLYIKLIIYLNKRVFPRLFTIIKANFYLLLLRKHSLKMRFKINLGIEKSIFRRRTVLKNMLKSLKYTWWNLM